MEAQEREGTENKTYYPRPSSAGPERCTRQMYYHKLGYSPAPINPRMWLVFDDSSWHEELTGDWIRKTTFDLHSIQMKVDLGVKIADYKFTIKGKIDGILKDLLAVERLFEHKAINHFSFERYWNADYGDLEALPLDNICQSCIYCNALQRESQPEIREILLVIKNKNTAHYVEYLIEYHREYDVALVKEMVHSTGERRELDVLIYFPVSYCVDKFERIETAAEEMKPPKREYDMDHWRCEYCPYGEECWKDYIKEMNKLAKGVILETDVADACRYYKEVSADLNEMEKEKDKVKEWIREIMYFMEASEGIAGEYKVTLKPRITIRVDKKLIPDVILPQVSKKIYSDTLNITKPMTKEEKAAKAKEKREQKKREKESGGSKMS